MSGDRDERETVPEAPPGAEPRRTTAGGARADARYARGAEIARGGMGRVVEATDTVLDRVVAIKEALAADGGALRRFQREIKITARLEHPSIVPVHDAGVASDGKPYYVMRKVSGRPLAELVDEAPDLPRRLALLPHVLAAAQAVAHAHARGVIHRDLKPSNVLVGEHGETVVIDWGLAAVIDEPDGHAPGHAPGGATAPPAPAVAGDLRTRGHAVVGTPGFMPREQICGDPVDTRADVYALGATLFHVLARRPPHDNAVPGSATDASQTVATAGDTALLHAAATRRAASIGDVIPGVPLEVVTIVDKALAFDPADRYRDAGELAEDLRRFLAGQLVAAHRYSRRERLLRFARRHRWALAVAAVATLGFAIGGWVAIGRIIEARDAAAVALAQAHERNDRLVLNQARQLLDTDPTAAVALVKPLAATHWREVRAIAMAAHANGVAWAYPASRRTIALELSDDGTRALSGGLDGVIRIHDLVRRTTQVVVEERAAVGVHWLSDHAIAIRHNEHVAIHELATGRRREIRGGYPINLMEIVGDHPWWIAGGGGVWRDDGTRGVELARDVVARELVASPDRQRVVLLGFTKAWLADATGSQLDVMLDGAANWAAWTRDSRRVALATQRELIVFDIVGGAAREAFRSTLQEPSVFGLVAFGARFAIVSPNLWQFDPAPRRIMQLDQLSGMHVTQGNTLVLSDTSRLTILHGSGDIVLRPPAATLRPVVASPRSPFVVAATDNMLLAWRVDELLPRPIDSERETRRVTAVGEHGVLLHRELAPTIWRDVVTGEQTEVAEIHPLVELTAPARGDAVLVVEHGRSRMVERSGRVTPIPGLVTATCVVGDHIAVATEDGALRLYDPRAPERPIAAHAFVRPANALGAAPGWLAARFADGSVWRRDLESGRETTASLDDTAFAIDHDGTVYFGVDRRLRGWRTSGETVDVVELHAAIAAMMLIDEHRLYVTLSDGAGLVVEVAGEPQVRAVLGAGSTAIAIGPEAIAAFTSNHRAVLVDPATGIAWTGPRLDAIQLSVGARRLFGLRQATTWLWTFPRPDSPLALAGWLEQLTNADAPAGPAALSWRW